MQYNNMTELLSESSDTRRYFLNLPQEMQIELHKFNDSVRTPRELRQRVEAISRENHFDVFSNYPHEYLLY